MLLELPCGVEDEEDALAPCNRVFENKTILFVFFLYFFEMFFFLLLCCFYLFSHLLASEQDVCPFMVLLICLFFLPYCLYVYVYKTLLFFFW